MKKIVALVLIGLLSLLGAALAESGMDRFMDTWVAEGFTAEIWFEDESIKCETVLKDGTFGEYASCRYDDAGDILICEEGIRFHSAYDEKTLNYTRDIVAENLTATFKIEENHLVCEDSEGLFEGVVLLRLDDAEAEDAARQADSDLIGEWQTEDGMSVMTIEKNPGGADWDVEITTALSQGAQVFKATIRLDSESFTYNKGKF